MSKEQELEETAASVLGNTEPSDVVPQLEPTQSRFTKSEKWFIVGFTAFVGLFRQSFSFLASKHFLTDTYSPLTSTIYLPAIPDIVVAFHKSTEFIYLSVRLLLNFLPNLPLTVYLGDGVHGATRRWCV